jgi:hypothetical protein
MLDAGCGMLEKSPLTTSDILHPAGVDRITVRLLRNTQILACFLMDASRRRRVNR